MREPSPLATPTQSFSEDKLETKPLLSDLNKDESDKTMLSQTTLDETKPSLDAKGEDVTIEKTVDKNSPSPLATVTTNATPSVSEKILSGEGATKSLKEVGHLIQSQAQTIVSSINNNVTSDNIGRIILNSFLVLVIAFLLYYVFW